MSIANELPVTPSVPLAAPAVDAMTLPPNLSEYFAQSWQEDQGQRYNPEVVTSLLREQVPVLGYCRWYVEEIVPGRSHTVLPLNEACTNQHCTHQAALLFLSADYTGGIAVGSLLARWPAIGVHPVRAAEKSMAMWLVKGDIKYFRPSCGRLDVHAEVEADRHDRLRKRYLQGKTVLETVTVRFRNGDVDVAEAVMTYYARQSDKLRNDGATADKVNVLYRHKLISSAELIAGVRAQESGGIFEDPYALQVAGEHGLALASRFCDRSPQLGGMVAARTRHLDEQILEFAERGGRDLILLGAGYDMRPLRLPLPDGMRVYELDFPAVLDDRQQRIADAGWQVPPGIERIAVPIDLRVTPLAEAMAPHWLPDRPVFIAWEGMSMYFEEPELRTILRGIAPVLGHPSSAIWIDFVDARAVNTPEIYPEVAAFCRGMELLGEPFVFGVDSISDFLESNGFTCLGTASSNVYFPDNRDPIYTLYNFCLASTCVAPKRDGFHRVSGSHDSVRPLVARPQEALKRIS